MIISPPIPAPARQIFTNGIRHPDCYLWDAWSCDFGDVIYLYTLAVSRRSVDGQVQPSSCRSNSRFHIRRFASRDGGASWQDLGVFQQPGITASGHDARNVWSGSVLRRMDGPQQWAAYTGIHEVDSAHPFLQCLAVGQTDCDGRFKAGSGRALLCPIADRQRIASAGYCLAPEGGPGSAGGEYGGPIMAWRDPFLFRSSAAELAMVWAAKADGGEPAMGLAWLSEEEDRLTVKELLPPIRLPDAKQFTQFEMPKIYRDPANGRYILIAATTDRRSEADDGSAVTAAIRIYTAATLCGPWTPGGTDSSILDNAEHGFGMTVLRVNQRQLVGIAPLTDQAAGDDALTLSARFAIDLASIGQAGRVAIGSIREQAGADQA